MLIHFQLCNLDQLYPQLVDTAPPPDGHACFALGKQRRLTLVATLWGDEGPLMVPSLFSASAGLECTNWLPGGCTIVWPWLNLALTNARDSANKLGLCMLAVCAHAHRFIMQYMALPCCCFGGDL